LAALTMLSTIDFDGESDCRTVEINNVPADRMLTAKTQTRELAALQHVPKLPFRFCSIPA